jgi:glutamine amidotransferase
MNSDRPVLIIDYGMGNIGSIRNMLRYVGARAEVATQPDQLVDACGIILPGVGHFDRAMGRLRETGMADALTEVATRSSVPVLGICLGMQLMCKSSEEGSESGLGFFDANVRRFSFEANSKLKVPHMGWNEVTVHQGNTLLGDESPPWSRYYFVHSYYVSCENPQDVIGTTQFGIEFVSAFKSRNLVGVQFHPEKSHRFGMRLFRNFVKSLA